MKFTINKNVLNNAIQHVSKAVASRTTIPILSGILVVADATAVTLTASDQTITIQSRIPLESETAVVGTVERPGRIVLTAKFFVEMIKKMPKDEIEIEIEEGFKTNLKSGRTKLQLTGLDPDEFPTLPLIESDESFSIAASKLRDAIDKTKFAVTTNEGTPVLMGVLLNLSDSEIRLVATDRHRMATLNEQVDTDTIFSNVLIGGKELGELYKVLPNDNSLVTISVVDNQASFQAENLSFFVRMVDGTYPDTSKIIPTSFKTEVTLNRKALEDSIDRAYLISKEEKTNIIRLMSNESGGITVSSTAENSAFEDELDVSKMEGEASKVAFNSKYALDALKAIDTDEVFIGFNGNMSPIIIKPVGGSDALHLVLPYRTTN